MARSLISVYPGCFSKNKSNQSKQPSPGSRVGKTTSYLPSAGSSYLVIVESFVDASWMTLHLNGRGMAGAERFVCTVQFLKDTAGNRVFPWRASGSCCGC